MKEKTLELLDKALSQMNEIVECGNLHSSSVWFKTADGKYYKLSVTPTGEVKEK